MLEMPQLVITLKNGEHIEYEPITYIAVRAVNRRNMSEVGLKVETSTIELQR
jgi:hypothetical protein